MNSNYKTPCYIVNKDDFEKNISMFQEALEQNFGADWILGYSFKTNDLPFVLETARDMGCYAEVVSSKEYRLAKEVGFADNHIIFNGPVKEKADFLEAVAKHCVVNVDAQREIDWLAELPDDREYMVGIRVNFDLEKLLPGHTLMAEEGGRFGFCDDNGELHKALEKIASRNVTVNCLHMHVSSKTKSPEIYAELVRKACEIIKREKLSVQYIDVGGSFFGGGDDGTAYQRYAEVIKGTLRENGMENVGIIVEPGASVIASCVSYMASVIDTKATTKNRFVVLDGSRLHVDPFFARKKYNIEIVNHKQNKECSSQYLVGFTCMEKDRFMELENLPELTEGDRVLFRTVGSYTLCMNSDFISSKPLVYAVCGGKSVLVRRCKTIQDYLKEDCMEDVE